MTLQQLRYACAVADTHSFAAAAVACGVTQPTLSAMIAKLEAELGAQLFDRRRKPVVITKLGNLIIERARRVLGEAATIEQIVDEARDHLGGTLRLGVLPTIAPYLLPSLLPRFVNKNPKVQLRVFEVKTEQMLQQLSDSQLDIGLAALPYNGMSGWRIEELYDEVFLAYSSDPPDKQYILPEDINPEELWVLEEGHCFGDQVLQLCKLSRARSGLSYASGSIDTLKRLVEANGGVTVLPELAVETLSECERDRVRPFAEPMPKRTVVMVMRPDFLRERMVQALREAARREPVVGASSATAPSKN